jgi:hypothetical protein
MQMYVAAGISVLTRKELAHAYVRGAIFARRIAISSILFYRNVVQKTKHRMYATVVKGIFMADAFTGINTSMERLWHKGNTRDFCWNHGKAPIEQRMKWPQ